MASSLEFLGNPCGNMPRARDSGDPGTTSLYRSLPDAAFRLVNGVGIATRLDLGCPLVRAWLNDVPGKVDTVLRRSVATATRLRQIYGHKLRTLGNSSWSS